MGLNESIRKASEGNRQPRFTRREYDLLIESLHVSLETKKIKLSSLSPDSVVQNATLGCEILQINNLLNKLKQIINGKGNF